MKSINALLVCDEETNTWAVKDIEILGVAISLEDCRYLSRTFEVVTQLARFNDEESQCET